jgi:N-acetylglucosamine kinase-like BadF-type ATPase
MKRDPSELVLGIDGGGTKTVAWLAASDGSAADPPLGHGRGGPGNPRSSGFETAQRNIAAAVAEAFTSAGLPPSPVAAACLGLAGAGRASEREPLHQWALDAGLAQRVLVTHDAEIALAAGTARQGIALICGTGSLAWGRNAAGESARAGGWGYLLGDEGSGYAIALAGLRAASRAADGRGPDTALLTVFLDRLGSAEPSELIERVYAPSMTRERLAALAETVFELAASDPVAGAVLQSAAQDLAELVTTLTERLQLQPGQYDLVLTGGSLVHNALLRKQLVACLDEEQSTPGGCHVVTEPVRGAVALARREQGAPPDQP